MRRTVIGLLLLSVLGIAASFALRETSAATVNQTSITYHGGPVMTGATDIYFIWCGNWAALTGPNSKDTQDILTRFGGEIGGSIHSQINATYPDGGGYPQSFIFGWFDTAFTPPGLDLDQQAIQDIVRESIQAGHLPFDPAGIYIVVASSDIASTATGLCTPNANPHHGSFPYNNQTVKYAFMGNAARCPNILASQFFAADGSQLPTPNGNVAADAMVSTLIHTMDATVTDPFHTAWYDGSGLENADKCNGSFSHTLTAANGARYNFTSNGAQDKYLIQDNWVNNYGGYCSQYNDAPPTVDDQSIQVNQDTAKPITLTGADDNGDPMSFIIVTPPRHGTLTGTGATRTYAPAASYHGPDSFTFKANDGRLDSQAVGTVSISVNSSSAIDGFDPNANGLVRTFVVQPDGKILIGRSFVSLTRNGGRNIARSHLARLNADGTVDPAFRPGRNSFVRTIVLQADGRILIRGGFTTLAPAGIHKYIARLNSDGTLDTNLNPNANDYIDAIAAG